MSEAHAYVRMVKYLSQVSWMLQILVVSTFSVASCLLLDQTFKTGKLDDQIGGQPSFGMQRNAKHGQETPKALASGLMWEDGMCLMVPALLELYSVFLHPSLSPTLPFMPLLLTSMSCSLVLVWVWIDLWIACYTIHMAGVPTTSTDEQHVPAA